MKRSNYLKLAFFHAIFSDRDFLHAAGIGDESDFFVDSTKNDFKKSFRTIGI